MAGLTPVLDAYFEGRQQPQQEQLGQLQRAQTLMGILSQHQQQQKRQAALAREQEFRGALSAARTPEEQQAVAMRYADPGQVIASGDRQANIRATKESTLARLQQAAEQFQTRHEATLRGLTRQEDRDAEIARHTRVKEQIDAQAQRMTGERLFYDTGVRVQPPAAGGAPTAPPAGGMAFNFGGGMQGTVPDEAAGAALWQRMGRPGTVENPAAPMAAPPAPAPAQPMAPPPPSPNNLDARDLGAWARGPVMGAAPVQAPPPAVAPAPATPAMPQFTGSPRQIASAQNAWRLAQDNIANAAARAKAVAEARASVKGPNQGRPLPAKAAEDIVGRETIISLLDDLIKKQETAIRSGKGFGGYGIDALGNVALKAGRALGENADEVNFFSELETIAQPDRHALFGATLTGNELNSWRTGWVGTGDHPQTLLNVMKQKRELYRQMMNAKTNGYRRVGFQVGGQQPATTEDADRMQGEDLGTGTANQWTDAKEQRYQELLRRRGGS